MTVAIGDIIPESFRNSGGSWGLEYPYIFGQEPGGDRWLVWHRHTGKVVLIVSHRYPILNEGIASKASRALNKIPDDAWSESQDSVG